MGDKEGRVDINSHLIFKCFEHDRNIYWSSVLCVVLVLKSHDRGRR